MKNNNDILKIDAIACFKCGEIIYSKHRHDFRWCGCQSVAIDGGFDYTKITGFPEDYQWMQLEISKTDFMNYKRY